jgi:flagellar L-ring protein precursor FlgH
MKNSISRRLELSGLLLIISLSLACGPKKVQNGAATALEAYVADAKRLFPPDNAGEGSLYADHGRRADLVRDPKAREVNDMVTIRVVESTAATSAADASSSKSSQVQTSVNNMFGLEKKIDELPNLVNAKSANTYAGKGATSRVTTVQTNLTARVIDVLPNGYLVVEGVKEIRLNNENQNIYVSGVVRPADITRGNIVLSSNVAQLSVHLQGRGVVSQPLNPGWLYRILSGIMPF